MAGPPTSAFTQATAVFSGQGMPHGAVTTFGIGTPTTTEAFEGVAAALTTLHQVMSSSEVRLEEVRFKIGPVATGPTFVEAVGQNGGDSTAQVSPNTATLIEKQVNGLSGRLWGRSFWPGLPEDVVNSSGALTSTWINSRNSDLDTFQDAVETLTSGLWIFPADGSDPNPVAALRIDARAATQRRRLRR